MGEGRELIEAVLVAVMAVVVGLTSASYGKAPPGESSDEAPQGRAMVFDAVMQSLAPAAEWIAVASPEKRQDI